ncbi:MAG: glycosyltransferase family 2 protein [Desulforhabdus sp.]|jgi:glycosyltransferase involved in cell wall biosynthesis|nr:glycosyltransferase family 2 protein [Desulforhabdus sp.]
MIPSISVITPSFNQGRFVERTINSVLSQDIKSLEYIIIDGGSSDETVQILERYGKQYGPGLGWISARDNGQADAINKGILLSSAPIIGWLNSDDIYYPGALRAVLDYFEQNPEAQVVYGDANHIDENDAFIERYPVEKWDWERLLEVCFISQPAAFVRREVFDRCGLLDSHIRHSNDYELWIRFGKYGVRFSHFPRLLAATRLHKECATLSASETCHFEINNFMRSHFGRVPDRWIFNYAHAVARAKGFRDEDRLRFSLMISLYSICASLRWNRRLTRTVMVTTARWVGHNTFYALKHMGSRTLKRH